VEAQRRPAQRAADLDLLVTHARLTTHILTPRPPSEKGEGSGRLSMGGHETSIASPSIASLRSALSLSAARRKSPGRKPRFEGATSAWSAASTRSRWLASRARPRAPGTARRPVRHTLGIARHASRSCSALPFSLSLPAFPFHSVVQRHTPTPQTPLPLGRSGGQQCCSRSAPPRASQPAGAPSRPHRLQRSNSGSARACLRHPVRRDSRRASVVALGLPYAMTPRAGRAVRSPTVRLGFGAPLFL
jgi:hypothetical protein